MKVCLSSRQAQTYLEKADEIFVLYKDKNSLEDLILKYPDKTFILQHSAAIDSDPIDWDRVKKWNILSKGKFHLCVSEPIEIKMAAEKGIKSFLGWLINDFETLNTVIKMGASYVYIGGSLFFDLDRVLLTGAKVRATPNIAFRDGLFREDGVIGTWIRPEDLEVYENYIETIEFSQCTLDQEKALYRIYMEDKEWPGDLGLLVKDLNHLGVNRMIHPELGLKRLNCRQICQSGGTCKFCYRILRLADPDLFVANE